MPALSSCTTGSMSNAAVGINYRTWPVSVSWKTAGDAPITHPHTYLALPHLQLIVHDKHLWQRQDNSSQLEMRLSKRILCTCKLPTTARWEAGSRCAPPSRVGSCSCIQTLRLTIFISCCGAGAGSILGSSSSGLACCGEQNISLRIAEIGIRDRAGVQFNSMGAGCVQGCPT